MLRTTKSCIPIILLLACSTDKATIDDRLIDTAATTSETPDDGSVADDTSDPPETETGQNTDDTGQETGEPPVEPEPPRTLTTGRHTIEHEGRTRAFRLYLPDTLPDNAALIIAFHGYGGSARGIQRYAGLDDLADTEGFAVVYPQSTQDTWGWNCWNIGYCDYEREVDDVAFARTVIDTVRADQGLGQIFVTGMSNGGDMSYRMACEASDLVDAVAPVTGCLMNWLADACTPAAPPPMLHIHGNADNTTMWDGDESYTAGGYRSTLESIRFIADLHSAETYTTERITDATDESAYTIHSWSTESGEVPVTLYEIDGGRHEWPTGRPDYDFDSAELMWSFFSRWSEESR
jgi:polyhydroxybutyrate depolymerase